MLRSLLLTIFLLIASTLFRIEAALAHPSGMPGISFGPPLIAQVSSRPMPAGDRAPTPAVEHPQDEDVNESAPDQDRPSQDDAALDATSKVAPPSEIPPAPDYDMDAIEQFDEDLYGD